MATETPKLVQDDGWLEPYTEDISQRIARHRDLVAEITQEHGSLRDYANTHEWSGIFHNATDGTWSVREWAPEAKSVTLCGDFNAWNTESHPLVKNAHGTWETTLPGNTLSHEAHIKLHIVGADGSERHRIPACIRRTIQNEETHDFSGQVWNPPTPYVWQHDFDPSTLGAPRIYEGHIGMAGEEPRVHTYREFADEILPRIAKGGYNVLQLMAVAEHPYYGSFGYHVSSYFAPSSRFGTPEDLKHLVDTAHGLGIAVLMDIVHSHSIKNYAEGLNNFDGSGGQYFHTGEHGDHEGWDSKCFDYGRPDVRRFLLSNVRYWIEEFRFDGFRFDGVTSLLYWHRGHTGFDHYDKYFRDGVDQDAILYLQLANSLIEELKPGALVIAEDMSGMPGLCRPLSEGGIGFTHRLAMGIPDYWIKLLKHTRDEDWDLKKIWDVLCNRRHGEANIAYAESHDQALVGDKTLAFWLMDKDMYWHMRKDEQHPVIERGIALHKMIRLLTFLAGGEGWLSFIGNEFGHPEWVDFPREGNDWSYQHCRRQWSLADDEKLRYGDLATFDQEMMALAAATEVLATSPAQLLHLHNDDKVLIGERGNLIFAFNFSATESFADYKFSAHRPGTFRVLLDTDSETTGGHGRVDCSVLHGTAEGTNELSLYLPARSALVLRLDE